MIPLSTVKFAVAGALLGAVARLATDLPNTPTVTPLPADMMTVKELPDREAPDLSVAQANGR